MLTYSTAMATARGRWAQLPVGDFRKKGGYLRREYKRLCSFAGKVVAGEITAGQARIRTMPSANCIHC
jgi:hypothetical protein